MEFYFLKSAACLAILMLFYKLLLEKENMHVFKRFYLLFAVLVSLVIPFITFTTYVEALPQQTVQIVQTSYEVKGEMPEQNINYWPYVLWSIYGLGVLFFSIIFIKNLRELFLKISRNPKQQAAEVVLVLLEEEAAPHTFWNYIFLNKKKFMEGSIPQEVLEHERAHARQKHSIDILIMELLQIIFWFYPLIYFVKKAIKLNHEFLADRAVISKGANATRYQHTLLAFSSNAMNSSLVNPINYSSIKKRITVMKTKTSRRTIWIRSIFILPLLAGLIYGFSTTEQVQKSRPETENPTGRVQENDHQKGTPPEMLKEYDSLVKYYNSFGDNAFVKQRDMERMQSIYNILTPEQKKKVAPREFQPVPPPIPAQWVGEKEATPAMIEEYNKLVRQYRSESKTLSKSRVYDYLRMRHIHSLMTNEQKNRAEPLPELLPAHEPTKQDSTPDKKLSLFITPEAVMVNGKRTNVQGIARLVDETTSDWTKADYNLHGLEIKVTEDVSKDLIDRLNVELEKTKLVRSSNSDSPYINQFINSDSPPAAPGIENYLTEDSEIYLNGKIISAEKALELFNAKRDKLKISILQNGENTVITMEEIK